MLQIAGDRRGAMDFDPRFLRRRPRAAHVESGRLRMAPWTCGEGIYKYFMIQPGSPGQACAHTLRIDQNSGT